MSLTVDLKAAQRHVHLLTGLPNPVVAWQVFDDLKQRPKLARGVHGRLRDWYPRFVKAQEKGCGVFIAVNETDGSRRRIENMVHARAVFLDLDGSPLPDEWPERPDLIIQSSARGGINKFQCWWLIEPTTDWVAWQKMQMAMAERYGGDKKCCMVTQVGRLAGFWHQKDPDHPWQVRIIEDNAFGPDVRHDLDRLVETFGFDLDKIKLRVRTRGMIDRPPPPGGYDKQVDVDFALAVVTEPSNWVSTSDGGVSVFKMACRLRDVGISPELTAELIHEHIPEFNDRWPDDYIERKVENAFRYASGEAGADSRAQELESLVREALDDEQVKQFLEDDDDE